ncbi:hypothetical protein Ahy_A09g045629 [Arachis hypogaea]|uniref:Uncharacterized protein n=1 Tax=Arachis hypogaea TaxID=3818 RepID=A0A445BMU9_ARAHY|nr:hypothetical protein Ahy_A09g045629 [Arachis hypogaea]
MSSRSNPTPEDAAALMIMARTASYILKEGLMPSFSLGLTDSSQEERAKTPKTPKLIEQLGELVEKITSSGVKIEGKSPQIQKQGGKESFEKFETIARTNEISAEMKEKCYVWATRVKTYIDGSTNEYDAIFHFASLKADTHIETEIVSAMCLILNQQNVKRFQEEIYCLPSDIVNMAVENHPNGKFLLPKTEKPFRVEDYPMFIPFLDLKKLASHPYGYYMLGVPLKRKDQEIELPYINISGQKTRYKSFTLKINPSYIYDCAIYVMKWFEIIQPENDEVDHYRVEYASWILFHKMNQDKTKAIRGSDAIRLFKPSSLLLSPYC